MQYRIWGELIMEGLHTIMPDNNTMFRRADDQLPMAKALTDAATAVTTILSRMPSTSG